MDALVSCPQTTPWNRPGGPDR